jgi:hypothetical protein
MKGARRKFSSDDDDELRRLVAVCGKENWTDIAACMRVPFTSRQCRDRWCNYLSPKLNHEYWTEEEDQRLLHAIDRYGTRWSLIAPDFPDRSGNAIQNRYFILTRRSRRHTESEVAGDAGIDARTPRFPVSAVPLEAEGVELEEVPPLPPQYRFPGLSIPPAVQSLPQSPHKSQRPGSLMFPRFNPTVNLEWLGTGQFADLMQQPCFRVFDTGE